MITAETIVNGQLHLDHVVEVPLDHATGEGRLSVFAREVVRLDRRSDDLPALLFLQGGPGSAAPRPAEEHPWVAAALERFRVVLLDQRGTGRSSRVEGATMARFSDAAAAARFLERFRADSIVEDAEVLRRSDFGGARWWTLGQSFGGFITCTYLSRHPEALSACLITGGLPSLTPNAAEVYRRTVPRAHAKNAAFRARYPRDVALLDALADRLASEDVRFSDGDRFTVRREQMLGMGFGFSYGYDRLHALLDEVVSPDELSGGFLETVQTATSFAGDPLWAVLQESIYGDPDSGATAWAADAALAADPAFDVAARPLALLGEHMPRWMLEEIRALRPFLPAADVLAAKSDWGPLYDRGVLAANDVPIAAAVYFDDLYVDAALSLETADRIGGLQPWVTNEYEHDGLRADTRVLRHLIEMIDAVGTARPA